MKLLRCVKHRTFLYMISITFFTLASAININAQENSASSFVEWANKNAIPLRSLEPQQGFDDLQPLKEIIGEARVVALGENAHGIHEYLSFRNRLFEFLVEELGFTAIALETGYTESVEVDDYVLGKSDGKANVASGVFSNAGSKVYSENQQLIDWMREYNNKLSTTRKIRFYGIDLTGQLGGKFVNSRLALDSALSYLELVDTTIAKQSRKGIEKFLNHFNSLEYDSLSSENKNTLTVSINELIGLFEHQKLDLIAKTSGFDYQRAYRHAVVARQLDGLFRVLPSSDITNTNTFDGAPSAMARDVSMADNVEWVLDQEGIQGRILLFAHNGHVRKYKDSKEAYPEFYPNALPTSMGEHLHSRLKNDMIVFGFTCNHKPKSNTPADSTSIDGVLSSLNLPSFLIGLNSLAGNSPIYQWLNQSRKMRVNDRYAELNLIKAFDALVFVERTNWITVIDSGFMNIKLVHAAVTGFLCIWGLAYAGLVIFSFFLSSTDHWAKLVSDGRIKAEYAEYISNIPIWVVFITFLVAVTRLAGAISLVFFSPWALPLFAVSLGFVIVIMYRGFFIANVASVIRPSQVFLEVVFLIISIGAVLYAFYMRQM